MKAVWVPSNLLDDRLDARYNSPGAVAARRRIAECGIASEKLEKLFDKLVCGPFGSTLTANEHDERGEILLAQPTNINEPLFTIEQSWRISRSTLNNRASAPVIIIFRFFP